MILRETIRIRENGIDILREREEREKIENEQKYILSQVQAQVRGLTYVTCFENRESQSRAKVGGVFYYRANPTVSST